MKKGHQSLNNNNDNLKPNQEKTPKTPNNQPRQVFPASQKELDEYFSAHKEITRKYSDATSLSNTPPQTNMPLQSASPTPTPHNSFIESSEKKEDSKPATAEGNLNSDKQILKGDSTISGNIGPNITIEVTSGNLIINGDVESNVVIEIFSGNLIINGDVGLGVSIKVLNGTVTIRKNIKGRVKIHQSFGVKSQSETNNENGKAEIDDSKDSTKPKSFEGQKGVTIEGFMYNKCSIIADGDISCKVITDSSYLYCLGTLEVEEVGIKNLLQAIKVKILNKIDRDNKVSGEKLVELPKLILPGNIFRSSFNIFIRRDVTIDQRKSETDVVVIYAENCILTAGRILDGMEVFTVGRVIASCIQTGAEVFALKGIRVKKIEEGARVVSFKYLACESGNLTSANILKDSEEAELKPSTEPKSKVLIKARSIEIINFQDGLVNHIKEAFASNDIPNLSSGPNTTQQRSYENFGKEFTTSTTLRSERKLLDSMSLENFKKPDQEKNSELKKFISEIAEKESLRKAKDDLKTKKEGLAHRISRFFGGK